MMALLRKDIRVARWDHVLAIAAFMLLSAQVVRYDWAYLGAGVALAGALTLLVPFFEWVFSGDRLLASLPVRRADIVRARYVLAALAVAIALVAWGAWGRVLLPLVDADRSATPLWGTVEGRLTFVLIAGLALAILLPLHFALGLGRAALAFAALSVGMALIHLLATGAPGNPVRAVESAVAALRARWGTLAALAAGGATFALMFLCSAWLAARAYERRAL